MSGKPTCEPLAGATRHFSPVVIATSTRELIRAATAKVGEHGDAPRRMRLSFARRLGFLHEPTREQFFTGLRASSL
jgi:hypothetical protein